MKTLTRLLCVENECGQFVCSRVSSVPFHHSVVFNHTLFARSTEIGTDLQNKLAAPLDQQSFLFRLILRLLVYFLLPDCLISCLVDLANRFHAGTLRGCRKYRREQITVVPLFSFCAAVYQNCSRLSPSSNWSTR